MRNFLFGRGASCGLFNRGGAAPLNPYAVAPTMPAAQAAPRRGCLPRLGLFNRNPPVAPPVACGPACGQSGHAHPGCESPLYAGDCCPSGYHAAMPGDCGCNYEGGSDPYLGGGFNYGTGSPDGYIDGGVYQGDGFVPRSYPSQGSFPSQGGYQSQRVDQHGDVIIQQDPLPPGAVLVD